MEKNKEELLKQAKRRVFLRKSVVWHLVSYVAVNVLLVAIYYFTTPGGYFWPIWSLLGWGFGFLCHAIVVGSILRSGRGTQDEVAREYERLLRESAERKGE